MDYYWVSTANYTGPLNPWEDTAYRSRGATFRREAAIQAWLYNHPPETVQPIPIRTGNIWSRMGVGRAPPDAPRPAPPSRRPVVNNRRVAASVARILASLQPPPAPPSPPPNNSRLQWGGKGARSTRRRPLAPSESTGSSGAPPNEPPAPSPPPPPKKPNNNRQVAKKPNNNRQAAKQVNRGRQTARQVNRGRQAVRQTRSPPTRDWVAEQEEARAAWAAQMAIWNAERAAVADEKRQQAEYDAQLKAAANKARPIFLNKEKEVETYFKNGVQRLEPSPKINETRSIISKAEATYMEWKSAVNRLKPYTNFKSKGWLANFEKEINKLKKKQEILEKLLEGFRKNNKSFRQFQIKSNPYAYNNNTVLRQLRQFQSKIDLHRQQFEEFTTTYNEIVEASKGFTTMFSNLKKRINGWIANEKSRQGAPAAAEAYARHKKEANEYLAKLNQNAANREKAATAKANANAAKAKANADKAATKIQKVFRGFAARKKLPNIKQAAVRQRESAARAKANVNAVRAFNSSFWAPMARAMKKSGFGQGPFVTPPPKNYWVQARKNINEMVKDPSEKAKQLARLLKEEERHKAYMEKYNVEKKQREKFFAASKAANNAVMAAGKGLQYQLGMANAKAIWQKAYNNAIAKIKPNVEVSSRNAEAAKQFASKARANAMAKVKVRTNTKIRGKLIQLASRAKARVKTKQKAAETEAREKRIQKAREELRAKITKQRNVISGVSGAKGAQVVKSSIRTLTPRR